MKTNRPIGLLPAFKGLSKLQIDGHQGQFESNVESHYFDNYSLISTNLEASISSDQNSRQKLILTNQSKFRNTTQKVGFK